MPVVQEVSGNRLVEREQSRENAANTKAAINMREEEDMDLRELIRNLAPDQSFQVKLIRRKPRAWGDPPVNIEGHLDTYDEWIEEEEIAELFGGGTYTLKVLRPNGKGSMVYFKSATVKIPGAPKGPGVPKTPDPDDDDDREVVFRHPESYDDPSVVSQAISTLQGIIESKNNSGMDPALLAAITGPMQLQIQQLQQTLQDSQNRAAEKDNQILELVTRQPEKPDTSANDRLMDKMFDSTNSRMESIRINHESEMRMIRENHRDDIKRIEDRYERAMDAMRESHNRQIHSMEEAHKREIASMDRSSNALNSASQIGYTSQIEVHKMENERLRGDLAALRAEVAELRAKKEKTLIEQASELQLVGEKLSGLGLGGFGKQEEEEPHWAEKLIGGVMDNPEIVTTVAQGITGAQQQYAQPAPPPAAPPQAPQAPAFVQHQEQHQRQAQSQAPAQLPAQAQQAAVVELEDIPIGQPFRGGDGEVYVKVPPDGSVVTLAQAMKMAKAEQAAAEKAAAEAAEEEANKPSPSQIAIAVTFAEAAFKNNTPPETFAQTARNSVPGHLLDYINEVGVDTFLSEGANLDETSPLRTQAGRNYMREVAEFLLPKK